MSIPQEIIEEDILTKLPVKSLTRFKCVSKPWLSLISSPRFVKAHLKMSSFSPRLVSLSFPGIKHYSLVHSEPVTEIIHTGFPEFNPNLSILGSWNGLLCLSSGTSNDYFLWNPFTRISKKLAPLNADEMDEWTGKMYQFAYNAVDDDYKIMRIFIKDGCVEVDVYSLRANSWKKFVCFNHGICPYSEVSFFAGKLHISTGTESEAYELGTEAYGLDTDAYVFNVEDIVSWDLENEVYGIIEQPDYGEGVKHLLLEEIEGWFCVVCRKKTHVDLWVMKEYGVKDSWCKMLTLSFSDDLPIDAYINPMIMLPSGDILLAFEDRFEVYNLKDNSRRVLETRSFGHFIYVESLVSPTQYD